VRTFIASAVVVLSILGVATDANAQGVFEKGYPRPHWSRPSDAPPIVHWCIVDGGYCVLYTPASLGDDCWCKKGNEKVYGSITLLHER
jgi:hypothetical protein